MTRYYKTDASVVLDAWVALRDARVALKAQADAVAANFGGKPVIGRDIHDARMLGIQFSPPRNNNIWTVPDPKAGEVQRPRARPKKGATKEECQALKLLNAQWAATTWPERVSMDPIYKAIGTDWAILFFGSFEALECDGVIYVGTSANLPQPMIEILGSEFHAAKEGMRKAA